MLIADIGLFHLGKMELAKELIIAANDYGADLVKGQAFSATTMLRYGTMTEKFYRQCCLKIDQCLELIYFARKIGNDLFFSTEELGYKKLKDMQSYQKVIARQSSNEEFVKVNDVRFSFISVKHNAEKFPIIEKARILMATDYCSEGKEIETILKFREYYGRDVGISDHLNDHNDTIEYIKKYNIKIVEKHFCLEEQLGNVFCDDKLYRDSLHAVCPNELLKIKKVLG